MASEIMDTASGGVMKAARVKIATITQPRNSRSWSTGDDAAHDQHHYDDGHLERDAEGEEHAEDEVEVRLDAAPPRCSAARSWR